MDGTLDGGIEKITSQTDQRAPAICRKRCAARTQVVKAAKRVLIGLGYGARQLVRHRHTKDPPPAGIGERLAALLRKDNEQNVKNIEKCKNKKANKAI